MARHGENIRKRKDGRWEGRYSVYSAEKEKKLYHSVYGRTYDEVREKLDTQKNLFNKGTIKTGAEDKSSEQLSLEDIMLQDAAKEWLEAVKCKRKQSTYVKYRLILQKHIEKILKISLCPV